MVDVSDHSKLLGDQNWTMLREVEIQKSEIRALSHQNGLKWPQNQELEIQKSEFRARWHAHVVVMLFMLLLDF